MSCTAEAFFFALPWHLGTAWRARKEALTDTGLGWVWGRPFRLRPGIVLTSSASFSTSSASPGFGLGWV